MLKAVTATGTILADALAQSGTMLDRRCAGQGICGKCRVRLLDGVWDVKGKTITAPAEALACQVKLLSPHGLVSIPENALAPQNDGLFADDWSDDSRPMPDTPDVVIGIDIGTTTIAAAAMQHGQIIARTSRFNPQSQFGDNVIARIAAASEHLSDLQKLLHRAIADMLSLLPQATRIGISCNSTMALLLHGIDPSPLGHTPFSLPQHSFTVTDAHQFGIGYHAPVYTVPLISAFLGGDVLAGICEVPLAPGDAFIDLGTNCEMVFRSQNGTYIGSSAAAGPAFEGAGISCGLRAIPGAVSHFRSFDDYDVIGGGAPRGFCGSGLVDVLFSQFRSGALTRFGRFIPAADSRQFASGIWLTESDIAELIKAKAAVAAGIATLERYIGSPAPNILLAGGFARFLNVNSAVGIGLIPPGRNIRILGNTSLAGACRLAADPDYVSKLLSLQDIVPEQPLNLLPGFENDFCEAMAFPNVCS